MGRKARPTILFKFRFAVADQCWRSTDFGHHWFHVARVHDHSPFPVPWWCLQCQIRWSTQRPVSNSIQLQAETWKQSAATGILNGLAPDYLSTIIPVVGLDITFLIAHLCLARSVWHWEPYACLAHWRRPDSSPRIFTEPKSIAEFDLRAPCRKHPHLSSNASDAQKRSSRDRAQIDWSTDRFRNLTFELRRK